MPITYCAAFLLGLYYLGLSQKNDCSPGHVVLRNLEHQLVDALVECDIGCVGIGWDGPNTIIGVDYLAVQPRLYAIVAEYLEAGGSLVFRGDPGLQIGHSLFATV